MNTIKLLFFFLCFCFILVAQQVPKWSLELDSPIESYYFLDKGNQLFLQCAENIYLYDAVKGEKKYALEIDDYEKEGIHQIAGNFYLVSADDKVQGYNALTGKLVWEKEYADVEQKDFVNLFLIGDITVLRFGGIHVGIDLQTGNELWRQEFGYNQKLYQFDTWNWKVLKNQNRFVVLFYSEGVGLFDIKSGNRVFLADDYEIEYDLAEKGRSWSYISKDERYIIFCLDGSLAVLDVVANKEIFKSKASFDADKEVIYSTDRGCVILGEENTFFFDEKTGKITEVKVGADDFRTFEIMKVADKDYLFAGLKNGMLAVDLPEGKVIWQSQKDDKDFAGYAHRYLKIDGNDLLMTYTSTSVAEGGANVYLMRLNALTGKVIFRTTSLGTTPYGTADWAKSLFGGLMKTLKVENTLGWENIGFDYVTLEYEGNIIFGTLSINSLCNPDTKEKGGDGISIINPKTGEILFKDYLRLSDYSITAAGAIRYADMMPFIDGNVAYLVGNENIAAYDLKAKKRLWVNNGTIKAIPREGMVVDNVLYVKMGEKKFSIDMVPPAIFFDGVGMKIENKWDETPYGFAAYDCTSGKLLWRIETETDPSFLTPNFSLKNNYDSGSKHLYFGDEENIYALQMKADGGKFDFTINLNKNDLGKMPYKKTYAIDEWPIGSIGYGAEYTYYTYGGKEYSKYISALEQADASCEYNGLFTIWGAAAKKCLRVVYDQKSIFVMGTEGIGLINATDGKLTWKHEWEYDQDNVQFMPHIIGEKLVYCVERKLTSVDIKTGATRWQAKEVKRPIFVISPNEKFIFTIDKEVIKGYEL